MAQLYVHIFLGYFPNRLLQDIEYTSLCSIMSLLFICFMYSSLYLLISFSSFIHPSFPFPFGNHVSFYVCKSVSFLYIYSFVLYFRLYM